MSGAAIPPVSFLLPMCTRVVTIIDSIQVCVLSGRWTVLWELWKQPDLPADPAVFH